MASDVRYAVVAKMLNDKGYYFDRARGSHHTFVKPGIRSFTFPVHHNRVKHVYVRQIQNLP